MGSKLALFGGSAITSREWPRYNTIGAEEKAAVMQVLDSGVLSDYLADGGPRFLGGPMVQRLESDWSQRFGVKYVVAMNSATSCMHAALAALGVGPGDEVLVPQLGMSAAAAVVMALGAKPVFTDCEPHTMHMDSASASSLVGPRTRAIIVVHLAGQPGPMDELLMLARRNNLFIVEDNAQAPGAMYKGSWAGTIGHIGCFSLNCHKIIQCGEGGIACTDDPELALRLRLFRNHGEKCLLQMNRPDLTICGLNLRLSELHAAVAIPQLAKLDTLNERTQQLCQILSDRLNLPGLLRPTVRRGCSHVFYIYHWEFIEDEIGVSADRFAEAVRAEGVPVFAHYGYLISHLPPFSGGISQSSNPYDFHNYPGASYAIRNSLWTMAIRPHLREDDVDIIVAALEKVYAHSEELQNLR